MENKIKNDQGTVKNLFPDITTFIVDTWHKVPAEMQEFLE